jgi:phosphatidylinositol alpha-1,6-mannosyltransferase
VTVLTKKVPGWKKFDEAESHGSLRIVRRFKPLPSYKIHQLPKIVFPFAEAWRLIHRDAIDMLHSGDLYPQGVAAMLLKRLLRIPYITYYHAEEVPLTDRFRYQPLVRNRIYREADAVVVACEFARETLIRIGISVDRIHKITPGVDYERFTPQAAPADLVNRLGLQNKQVLLTVARLLPRKGHDVALRAVARILPDFPNLHYLIVGTGPDEQRLRKLIAELGIGGAVTLLGYVPDDQLPDFYHSCDVFTMPNREEENGDIEGFGMIFMEASAAGKPVVGGRSGGTADAVLHGVTGMLVNPKEVDDVAATLKLLFGNPDLRRRLGSAGSRRAREEFRWSTRAELLRHLSDEIVQKSRRHARDPLAVHSEGR